MMSGLRGCGAMATIVSLCFPHAIARTRRMMGSEMRSMTGTASSPISKPRYTKEIRDRRQAERRLQSLLEYAGIARQLDIANARHRPSLARTLHRDAPLPIGDLSAGTRDQLLVADGWHQLDDQSQARHGDSPPARIARAALPRAP